MGCAVTVAGLLWMAISGGEDWPGWFLAAGGTLWLVVAWRR